MTEYDPTLEYRSIERAGMSFRQIPAALTTAPAARFGNSTETTGRLATRMQADIVVLDSDPARDITAFARVRLALSQGRLVYEPLASAPTAAYPQRMKPAPTKYSIPPLPAVLLAMISVQGGAALAKGLFPVLGPVGTVGLRIGLSALMLLSVFRPRLNRLNPAQWRAIIPYGVVLGVMNMLFYLSLSRIPLGLAVTVEFSGPLAVAVFGSRKAVDLLWVVLAGVGIALITPWSGSHGVDPVGVLLAGAAGACWAAYIVLGGRVSRILPGGAAVAVGMLVAAITAVPIAVAMGGFTHLTAGLFAAGAGVALLSSAIPYSLEMIGLKAIPARTFGILMSLEPALAAFAGLIFLHEVLTPPQWLAVALVIAASTGSTLASRRADRNEADTEAGWQGA